MILNLSRK